MSNRSRKGEREADMEEGREEEMKGRMNKGGKEEGNDYSSVFRHNSGRFTQGQRGRVMKYEVQSVQTTHTHKQTRGKSNPYH